MYVKQLDSAFASKGIKVIECCDFSAGIKSMVSLI
jgi:hypothetical protein